MLYLIKFNCYNYNKALQMPQSFLCRSLSDLSQIRINFLLTGSEKVVYLTLGPLSLLVSIFNIFALLGFRPLREPPSDILLLITFTSIVKLCIIYSTMIYNDHYSPETIPSNFVEFCQATGAIDIASHLAKIMYTVALSLMYIRQIKNPLKAWANNNKEIHFICVFLVMLVTLILYFTGQIGLSIFGFCSYKFTLAALYIQSSADLIYLCFLITVSTSFLRYIARLSATKSVVKQFFKYYLIFLVIVCTNQVMLTISEFMMSSLCQQQSNKYLFLTFRTLANIFNSVTSFFVLAIILSNPQFRRIIILHLSGLRDRYNKWIKKRQEDNLDIRPSFYNELMTTNRNSIFVQLSTLANLEHGYLSDLKDKNRACLLSSLLGCLSIQSLQINNYASPISSNLRTSAVEQDNSQVFAWSYTQTYSFTLNNAIVDYYERLFIKKLPAVRIKFVSYAPNVLKQFTEMNNQGDIEDKLFPTKNENAIIHDCNKGSDGGSSGQFFFFNYDRTFILKTISSKEKEVFLSRLQDFHLHFQSNPKSLIVKICSIFTAKNTDTNDQINFMLMRNILKGIDKQYVLRSYDLKGSFHNREVIKKSQEQPDETISKTLKDVDFERLEEKIWLGSEDCLLLKKIIRADSQFFCGLGLIDYSLIVIKLNLRALEQNDVLRGSLKNFNCFRSMKDNGVGYVFGIIDYLQTWNIKKKGQKWYKSLFTKSNEISSQNPAFYSERFIYFTQQIFSPY